MKITAGGVLTLTIVGIGLWLYWPSLNRRVAEASEPESHTKSYSLLPTQSLTITNKDFRRIEVTSSYPVSVVMGSCHIYYTVQAFCNTDPADVFVTDARAKLALLAARANVVSVTYAVR